MIATFGRACFFSCLTFGISKEEQNQNGWNNKKCLFMQTNRLPSKGYSVWEKRSSPVPDEALSIVHYTVAVVDVLADEVLETTQTRVLRVPVKDQKKRLIGCKVHKLAIQNFWIKTWESTRDRIWSGRFVGPCRRWSVRKRQESFCCPTQSEANHFAKWDAFISKHTHCLLHSIDS